MQLTWTDPRDGGLPSGPRSDRATAPPRIPVLELGDPSGPPIVLLPGLTDGLYPVFDAQGRGLYAEVPVPMERCRGLAVSYRHPLTGVRTTAELARDVAAALRERLDRPAVLIAHSMGTMVAQHLGVAHPQLVAGMVLSAPLVAVDDDLRDVVERWAGLVRAGRWEDMAHDALVCSYRGDELERRRRLLEVFEPGGATGELARRHLRLSDLCLGHRPPAGSGLPPVPALLLAGGEDPVAPPRQAQALAAQWPTARLHILPGLAHGFPEQAPAAFSTFVTSFLGEVAASCASWVGGPAA